MKLQIAEELIVGTNEEFILGYNINKLIDGSYSFEASFTNHSHCGRVKTLSIDGNFLVSGGSDEYMRIFNLKHRTEVGSITPHEATITCIQFHSNSFVLTGAENGKIGIFKKGKWEPLKFLSGHKSSITGIGIHPSGKLAHTISRDRKMLTWDLTKGKRIYTATLKTPADDIQWSPSGSNYLVTRGNLIDVYTLEAGNVIHTINFEEKICALRFISEDVFIAGGESPHICLYDLKKKEIVLQWESGQGRIKGLERISDNSEKEDCFKFVSASSDGTIKLWRFEISSETVPVELAVIDTTCRIICMGLYSRYIYRTEDDECENDEVENPAIPSEEEGGYSDLEVTPNNVFGEGVDFISRKSAKRKRVSLAEESVNIEQEEDDYTFKPSVRVVDGDESLSEEELGKYVKLPKVPKKEKNLKKKGIVRQVKKSSLLSEKDVTSSPDTNKNSKNKVKKSKVLNRRSLSSNGLPKGILKT